MLRAPWAFFCRRGVKSVLSWVFSLTALLSLVILYNLRSGGRQTEIANQNLEHDLGGQSQGQQVDVRSFTGVAKPIKREDSVSGRKARHWWDREGGVAQGGKPVIGRNEQEENADRYADGSDPIFDGNLFPAGRRPQPAAIHPDRLPIDESIIVPKRGVGVVKMADSELPVRSENVRSVRDKLTADGHMGPSGRQAHMAHSINRQAQITHSPKGIEHQSGTRHTRKKEGLLFQHKDSDEWFPNSNNGSPHLFKKGVREGYRNFTRKMSLPLPNRPIENRNRGHTPEKGMESLQGALLVTMSRRRHLAPSTKSLVYVLEYTRLFSRITLSHEDGNLPSLITSRQSRSTHSGPKAKKTDQPIYSVVLFDSLQAYTSLSDYKRLTLAYYCASYGVAQVIIAEAEDGHLATVSLGEGQHELRADRWDLAGSRGNVTLESVGEALRVMKAGPLPISEMSPVVTFTTIDGGNDSKRYVPMIATNGYSSDDRQSKTGMGSRADGVWSVALIDTGGSGGVKRAFVGAPITCWPTQVIMLDALDYLSGGRLSIPLERYVMIDIDDIFLALPSRKIHRGDVEAMLEAQRRWSDDFMTGFKFNLGFVGKYYLSGTPADQDGDRALVGHSSEFNWFGHTYTHQKAHLKNEKAMRQQYRNNKYFAQNHSLSVIPAYAVAPHHSGVFPVHDALYTAWREEWGVTVTTTEEYPHFKGANRRRGFTYRGLRVLPRQVCGLYTTNPLKSDLRGGMQKLNADIDGGTLFQTFLYNAVNVYMTHTQNYGSDRLALYLFDRAFSFVHRWTNLKLSYLPPAQLADRYFSLYPGEVEPMWTNPCADERHLAIWPPGKLCRLPQFLIVGPQKTGTTALHSFLSFHPSLSPSKPSTTDYEEVQFFNNDRHYMEGINWYMDFFTNVTGVSSNGSSEMLFEKSANYFDSSSAPRRAHFLLPNAKIIVILIDPVIRAFSWYQHMIAHGNEEAKKHTFYDVVTAGNTERESPGFLKLWRRTVGPGEYWSHLERWLQHYSPNQILLVDGNLLKENPPHVLTQVQRFLKLDLIVDYKQHLRFMKSKGFWCLTLPKKVHCLGDSKGRSAVYGEPDEKSRVYLETEVYDWSNKQLRSYLFKHGYSLPTWLSKLYKS